MSWLFYIFTASLFQAYLSDASGSVLCPGGEYTCPDGSTCCAVPGGGYGCCPLPRAVCCRDHSHCCPHNTQCDIEHQRCLHKNGGHVSWRGKEPGTAVPRVSSVTCPDQRSQCPDRTTCCRIPGGRWGCCPMPQAVCCADLVHCCPHGTTCDLKKQSCDRGDGSSVRWRRKEAAEGLPLPAPLTRRLCPDEKSSCPNAAVCCRIKSGGYGCCPYANGVCCADKEHCCPHNTKCDLERKRCIAGNFQLPWASTFGSSPASGERAEKVCEDGSVCRAPGTCCRQRYGLHFACCPIPNATCCGSHCCPGGYRCARGVQKCIRDAGRRPELPSLSQFIEEDDDFFF